MSYIFYISTSIQDPVESILSCVCVIVMLWEVVVLVGNYCDQCQPLSDNKNKTWWRSRTRRHCGQHYSYLYHCWPHWDGGRWSGLIFVYCRPGGNMTTVCLFIVIIYSEPRQYFGNSTLVNTDLSWAYQLNIWVAVGIFHQELHLSAE